MLSCSALNAVRSRRPPLPPGSSGPEHSGPPSGGGCSAPHGRPPAPGEREKGVSQGQEPRVCPFASGQPLHCLYRGFRGSTGPVRPRPPSAGCPDGRGDCGYLQRGWPSSAPCSCRLFRPAGRRTAPCSARSRRG